MDLNITDCKNWKGSCLVIGNMYTEIMTKIHLMICFRNEELFVLNNISLGYNNHHKQICNIKY